MAWLAATPFSIKSPWDNVPFLWLNVTSVVVAYGSSDGMCPFMHAVDFQKSNIFLLQFLVMAVHLVSFSLLISYCEDGGAIRRELRMF